MRFRIILFVVLSFVLSTMAQVTGGGVSHEKPSGSAHLYQSRYNSVGGAFAMGDFRQDISITTLMQLNGMGGKAGFAFNTGKLFYIKAAEKFLGKRFGLGVDASFFNFRMNWFDWDNIGYTGNGLVWSTDIRLGVGFGISLKENMSVDIFWNINPGFSWFIGPEPTLVGADRTTGKSLFKGVDNVVGARFRYKKLFTAIEFQIGAREFEADDNGVTFKYEVGQSTFNLLIGKCF